MSKAQFGMIGLGTMGRNFLLNVAGNGFSCLGYDLDAAKRLLLLEEGKQLTVEVADSVPASVAGLDSPRKVMLLVPAGPIVDAVIAELLPHLEAGDLVIDGGNSHFEDTERREKMLAEKNMRFLGVGVSGGEEGARHGASIMAGGDPDVYEHVRPMLEAVAAKVDGEPCAAHVGRSSAGHFVKMVHNGIEYGLMQLIAEAYDVLRRGLGMETQEIAAVFEEWNRGELGSFLIEITATVLKKQDEATGRPLVDLILDTAGQKGTGRWTSQVAMDFGVPIPTIDSAVTMRQLSARKSERLAAANVYVGSSTDRQRSAISVAEIEKGLICAFIITFAQGLSLLKSASVEKNLELDLHEISKIWRGGCIIRAKLLEDIRQAFTLDPELENILVSDVFAPTIRRIRPELTALVRFAADADIPSMSCAASLNYLNAYSAERLPANLIQAQRDFFGAHTYQRTDEAGMFHTPDWEV